VPNDHNGAIVVESSTGERIIPVEISDDVARAMGSLNDNARRAYLEELARRTLNINRLFGLPVDGIKKFIICTERLPGSELLFEPNTGLWERLRTALRKESETGAEIIPRLQIEISICAEDESCACSWCTPPVGISI
jgi:hypothetical protein